MHISNGWPCCQRHWNANCRQLWPNSSHWPLLPVLGESGTIDQSYYPLFEPDRSSREPPLPDLPSQTRLTQVPVNNGILSILRAAGVHTFFLRLLNHPFNISPEYWLQLWRYILCLDWGHIRVYTGQNSCDCTLKIFAFHYISIWPQFIFWRKSL